MSSDEKRPTEEGSLIELGYVSGVFGIRGEVRLFLHNRESHFLHSERDVQLVGPDGARREVRLRARSGSGGRVLGRVSGVTNPEDAAALHKWKIEVAASELPALEEGEYYISEVLGMAVEVAGALVGDVIQVHSTGPTDVFEVRLNTGQTGFVPMLPSHVLELDLSGRRVVVAPGAIAEAE